MTKFSISFYLSMFKTDVGDTKQNYHILGLYFIGVAEWVLVFEKGK